VIVRYFKKEGPFAEVQKALSRLKSMGGGHSLVNAHSSHRGRNRKRERKNESDQVLSLVANASEMFIVVEMFIQAFKFFEQFRTGFLLL
jgi:hypothetical protein